MNPEVFIKNEDKTPLTLALIGWATRVNVASDRQDLLLAAGIDASFLANLRCDTKPNIFASGLVAEFIKWKQWTYQRWDYHPLVTFLKYLRDLASSYGLAPEEAALFTQLVERGQENLQALVARSAVGRIESPQGVGIGTGILVEKDLLLTCYHVFSKNQFQPAWVRFNYKSDGYELPDYLFELDLDFISHSSRPDYALVTVKEEPKQPVIKPVGALLDTGEEIRLIHHPQGNYVRISELGKIVQVGEDYIHHHLNTAEGSSGAPIFNRQWQLIGIHRGHPGVGGRSIEPNTREGVPLRAIWEKISPHLA